MGDFVQIEKGYHTRRMKDTGDLFEAKKTDGGGWYYIKFRNGQTCRHLAEIVEYLSEEVKNETSSV